jgi:hypothetical protein
MTVLVPLTSLAVLGTALVLETAGQLSALPRSKVAAGAEQVAQHDTERRGSSINTGATDQIVGLHPKSPANAAGASASAAQAAHRKLKSHRLRCLVVMSISWRR